MTAGTIPALPGREAREDRRRLVERLAEDMVRRWRTGDRPGADKYLATHPELADHPEEALELVAEEIGLRSEAGQSVEADDLQRRFPQWQPQVQALLECHRVVSAGLNRPCFPRVGESLGDFRLLAELGRGGHARVFLARQAALAGRLVVLKLAPGGGREHLALSRLQHTHIMPLYSVHDFPERDLRGLCQPYFGGASLADLLARLNDIPAARRTGLDLLRTLQQTQALAPAQLAVEGPACRFLAGAAYGQAACWLGACLANALQYAHERGLLHLDLKPSNVLLAADGQPLLLDFHLAHAPLPAGGLAPAGLGGTPGYMAPEHQAALTAVAGRRPVPVAVDARADIYSLGVLLYSVLGGPVPIPAERPGERLRQRNPWVSVGLAALLGRCLAADPAQRYPSAGEVAADLRRHLADLPLQGVANRSPTERWRKWRRRRPLALPIWGLFLMGVMAATLLIAHGLRQTRMAEAALQQGEEHLRQRDFTAARDAFQHGAALMPDWPLRRDLPARLQGGLERAERGRAARELHLLCERIRPLYGSSSLPPDQARLVAETCRAVWQKRDLIACRLGDSAAEREVQTDLLDLAILWTNLRAGFAPPNEVRRTHQEALSILDEAESLFGSSCVLAHERQNHAGALGLTELAEAAARRETALTPRDAWEFYALGRAYLQAGDLRRAAEYLDRALQLQPQGLWPNFYRGICAHRLGDDQDALAAFAVCVALAPQTPACYTNRGHVYAALGRTAQAQQDYKHARQLEAGLQERD